MALKLDSKVKPIDVPGARQLRAKMSVNTAQMRFVNEGDKGTDQLDDVWIVAGENGAALGKTSQPLKMALPQANYEAVMRQGLSFSGTIDLSEEATEVRVVARDSGTGVIGSVVVPLGRLFTPAKAPGK